MGVVMLIWRWNRIGGREGDEKVFGRMIKVVSLGDENVFRGDERRTEMSRLKYMGNDGEC